MTLIKNAYNTIKGAVKKFGAENGSLIAAAISFYAVLSLLPLLLLAVSVVGYVLGSSQKALGAVTGLAGQFIPSTGFINGALQGLVRERGTIGIIGLLALLWTGSQLFVTLQVALDDIWEVDQKPGFIKGKIKAILLVLVFGVFLLLSIASTSIAGLAPHIASGTLALIVRVVAAILGLVFAIVMFVIAYKYVPGARVPWRSALLGAIFAGIAWTIAKDLYAVYLGYANFNKLYGSLGSVVILILWIYYSSVILVMGGELAYVSEHGPRDEPEEAKRIQE